MAKITKMQQRRGLRRDLPVPLAPGEFALTTDTRELFIGGDTSDKLSGVHNKTLQLGSVLNGSNFAESLLQNNITEFIVKRSVITGVTGTGPTPTTGFSILSLHVGLSNSSGGAIDLEGGINDQTLTVYKYSPPDSSHKLLKPSDPDGAPIVTADYDIVGANEIRFTTALLSEDIVYVSYFTNRDLEKHLINTFNDSYDLPAGSGNSLSDLVMKLSTNQLYFDESTGEGFIGFNNHQSSIVKATVTSTITAGAVTAITIVDGGSAYLGAPTVTVTNATGDTTGAGASASATVNAEGRINGFTIVAPGSNYTLPPIVTVTHTTSKTIKQWFDDYISDALSPINAAVSGLGNGFWGNGDGTIVSISYNGGRGVAKFGDDAGTSVPTYAIGGDLSFSVRSHLSVINMSKFFNHIWLAEGSDVTKQLSHVKANIKVMTESNIGDVFADITIGNPTERAAGTTDGTNPVKGSQVFRPVGSVLTTSQALAGVVYFDASTTTSIYLSYTILFDNSPTYYVLRVGQVSASMPIMPTATPNPHGHGLILDTWNELDILNSAGTIPTAFGATTVFELGIVVSRRVTLYGDPVIEDEWLTLPATGTGSFASKYGTTSNIMNTDVFYVDSEPTSPTYQKYFGFLLYKNTRPVDATIKFIQERF